MAGTPIPRDGTLVVSVAVTNTGAATGEEVAQLYVRRLSASVTTPIKSLKGFQRLHLAPGATATATFSIDVGFELRVLNRSYAWNVEPGDVKLMVGGGSDDANLGLTTTVTLG